MRTCTSRCEWTNLEPERGYKAGQPTMLAGQTDRFTVVQVGWSTHKAGKEGRQNFGNIWRHFCISDKSLL